MSPEHQDPARAPERLTDDAPLGRTILSHPGSSYLIVVFLVVCVTALMRSPVAALLYLIPVTAALFVARTATIIDADGLTARRLLGSATVTWAQLRGLQLDNSGAVYAVDAHETRLKLPCVRSTKLTPLIRASGGRIPDPGA